MSHVWDGTKGGVSSIGCESSQEGDQHFGSWISITSTGGREASYAGWFRDPRGLQIKVFRDLKYYIYLYHTTSRKCFNPLALPTFVTQKCLNGVSCCGTMPNRVQPKSWSALLRLASGFLASTFASLSWELNHCGWLDRPLAISHGNRGTKCAFFFCKVMLFESLVTILHVAELY